MKGPCQTLFVQASHKTFFFFIAQSKWKKKNSFGTEGQIELKPSSKFEFVHCLNVYKKIKGCIVG